MKNLLDMIAGLAAAAGPGVRNVSIDPLLRHVSISFNDPNDVDRVFAELLKGTGWPADAPGFARVGDRHWRRAAGFYDTPTEQLTILLYGPHVDVEPIVQPSAQAVL